MSLRVHRTATGRITKTWRQRVRIEGRLTSIGLGPYPEITLAEARQKALDNSRAVRHGGDPRGRGVPTFAEAAERTIRLHRDGWKAGSPLPEQWESTFRLHAAPLLDMPVDRITSADVLGCLAAIWTSKPAAARKARNRIAAVFRWCIGRNHRADNPVDRAVVALPRANGNAPRHYRALPHGEVAAVLWAIRRVKYIHPSAVLCVEMIALTAVRAGEARGARWDEIDLEAGVWTIPASRMKAGREFSVPLSTGALEVLERARALSPESSLVFPSRTGALLPRNAPGRVLRRAGAASTVHGFRSSARSWMAESGVPAEVAEACLSLRDVVTPRDLASRDMGEQVGSLIRLDPKRPLSPWRKRRQVGGGLSLENLGTAVRRSTSISGKIRAVGSPQIDDLRSPRGTGRAERGHAGGERRVALAVRQAGEQ